MVVNKKEFVALTDVDETLVTFQPIPGQNPIIMNGTPVWVHFETIQKLKEHKARGHFNRVHSAGGWEWAEFVVKTLQIEHLVDSVETKPRVYYDDLDANEWMSRIDARKYKGDVNG